MRRSIGLASILFLLVVSPRAVAGRFPDRAADFVIDLTEEIGKPVGLLVRSRKRLWQLPSSQVRQGYGLAWFSIAKNSSSNSEARILSDVQPLEGLSLFDAVAEASADLETILGAAQVRLVGEATQSQYRVR